MVKKKQPVKPKPGAAENLALLPAATAASAPIDLSIDLQRSEGAGFGALPFVEHDTANNTISSMQLLATLGRLHTEGFETQSVSLREWAGANSGDDVADSVLQWWISEGTAADWLPPVPDDDQAVPTQLVEGVLREMNGWVLAAILDRPDDGEIESDCVALWVRDPRGQAPAAPDDENQARAAMFLIGNLMEASKRRFMGLAVPWSQLTEHEQSAVLRNLADDVRLAVACAIKAIASNQRLTFRAEVESVQFKGASDIKAVLKLTAGTESHALADSAGGFVTVVIESVEELLDIPDEATRGDADQRPLFDDSTAAPAAPAASGKKKREAVAA